MAFTVNEKAVCVLEIAKTESIVTVQRRFRIMYHTEPPTDKTIREWYMNSSRVAAGALRKEQAIRAYGPGRPVRFACSFLYLLICSFLPCLSWLLRSRVRKSRRDLWITLYNCLPKLYFRSGECSNERTEFDVHVTVHRDKFLITKPTRCTNSSNLIWNETLRVSESSSVHHQAFLTVHTAMVYIVQVCWQRQAGSGWNCRSILILLASCQQNCMTCTIPVCTVKNSWWWTEELSETCRVSFQK